MARPAAGRRLRLLLAAALGAAAAGQAAPSTVITDGQSCELAFLSQQPAEAARRLLATGLSLPYDAGKYPTCAEVPNSRFLLLTLNASLLKPTGEVAGSFPGELGICAPEACSSADAQTLADALLLVLRSRIPQGTELQLNATATSDEDVLAPGPGNIAAKLFVAFFAVLVLVSTAVVLRASPSPSVTPVSREPQSIQVAARGPRIPLIFQAFSLAGANGTIPKLLECPPYKPTDCLNGIRVISMWWIILGHTFLMAKAIAGYSNVQDIIDTPVRKTSAEDDPFMMLILSAQISVDTFFFLSGFLLSLVTLKELASRNGRINIAMAVVLRYLRLTPSLAFALLVYYMIWPYMGYGPFASRYQASILDRCDGSWWSELLYSMNFFPFDSDKVCMGWTWYLGVDMIFFIVGIILLPLYYNKKFHGWAALLGIVGVEFGVATWLIFRYHLSVYVYDYHYLDYSYYAYSKPYTRAPAYLVGIAAAWVLDDMEKRGITRGNTPNSLGARVGARVAAAIAAVVLMVLVFFPATDFGKHKNEWSDLTSSVYLALGRPLWSLCWVLITFLCYYGYLPEVDGFLAHPIWTPLARLTYGAYLLHPLVIKLAAGRAIQYYTFSPMDVFYRWAGNTVGAFAGSLLLWILVERPIMTLTSAAIKKPRSQLNLPRAPKPDAEAVDPGAVSLQPASG